MSLTFEQAYDEMMSLLNDVWTPTGYTMHWEGVREDRDTDSSPWASVVVRHADGGQRTLGGSGSRIFNRTGVIIVEVNTPSTSGLSEAYQLAKVVADAYEGSSSPNGVWFRNVSMRENGRDGTFNKLEVVVEFNYHELK